MTVMQIAGRPTRHSLLKRRPTVAILKKKCPKCSHSKAVIKAKGIFCTLCGADHGFQPKRT